MLFSVHCFQCIFNESPSQSQSIPETETALLLLPSQVSTKGFSEATSQLVFWNLSPARTFSLIPFCFSGLRHGNGCDENLDTKIVQTIA